MTTNIEVGRTPDFPSGAELTGIVNDDPFHSALIARLANEIFAEARGGPALGILPGSGIASPGIASPGIVAPAATSPATTPPSFAPAPPSPLHLVLPSADAVDAGFGVPVASAAVPTAPTVPGAFTAPSNVTALPWVAPETVSPAVSALEPAAASRPPVHPPHPGAERATDVASSPHEANGHPGEPAPFGAEDSYPFGEPRYAGALAFRHHAEIPTEGRYGAAATPDFYFLQHGGSRKAETRVEPQPRSPQAPAHHPAPPLSTFDVQAIRRDFPALHQTVNGKPLVWLDNAATTHKPQSVIDITSEFYSRHNSNIHRAAHTLAARSTDLFEGARDKLRDFVGAADSKEIIFLRGTTEAINLVAQSYGRSHFKPGDEIVVTHIEHHANIVPWQLVAQATEAVLRAAPVNDRGELIFDKFVALLGPRTKFVSVTHVANALGTINPVEQIIAAAHAWGVPVLIDAAQSSPHIPLDVRALDADFLVLSGHKVFGPTGIGILYGKAHLLEALPPWQGGGHMIRDVTFEKTVFNHIPEKFEAGTPDIAGAVGLGAAIDYLQRVGLPAIAAYEHDLLVYATEALATVPKLRLIGTAAAKASVLSFVIDGYAPDAVSRHLDKHGIATRSGHHCAQPALRRFGVETTVRASLAFYNTREDVDALIRALHLLPRA
ncbi:cysteine desulfurase [Segnochrobactrum spirostomi]|uniref:cysteine desulfurase n=1 Tax=Segnochrobactrum spirostomi TaxID=2608987 RepID=A0A6A7YB37_9HYPH|nr:cysteine desulfurase [Segnochrobactrum spirostomi]MQT14639.1 SufS family cysteine desulfurase [Segnochrobactrum spirostomi]